MTRPTLAEMGILDTNSGIWIHQCPHDEGDLRDRAQARAHGQELRDRGITGIMQLGSTTRVESSIGYREAGVSTIFRPWRGHTIGAPPAVALMPANEVEQFVVVGTKIIQPFNEQNLPDEWLNGTLPKRSDWARIVVDLYEASLDWYESVGAYSALPPLSPGGVYGFQHRECWDMMLAEIVRRNLQSRIKVVCLHPRPHNFPPETPYSDTLTVAFREYERYIATAKSAGIDAWYYAGEHGASIGNRADPARPEVDLPMWTDWNRTFYLWMNPDHASPYKVQPEMFALCYWLSGDGGTWFEDSIDQGRGRMPAPSPLYVWMREHKDELDWTRGDDSPPPPPPPVERARGFDCSQYQGDINWQAVADDFSFVFIRASTGANPDTRYAENYDAAHDQGLLVGAYHYLAQADSGQAALFYNTVGDRVPELGYYADLEAGDLTADKCQLFLEYADNWTGQATGIYTRASFFDRFGQPLWTMGRPLWVAHWGVDNPTLPQAWSTWEFCQTVQGEVAGQTMDLNEYNGTDGALFDKYGPQMPPPGDVEIIDITGQWRDWAWLQTTYGAVEILPADGYQVTKIIEVEGLLDFTCTLLNEAGGPVAGQQVAYVTPTQDYIEITDSYGVARHTAGSGEGYWLPGPGVVGWYVVGQEGERITGLGWLRETQYRHLQITMQLEGEPPPPDDWQEDTTARLERIEQLLIHVHGHLGPD